MPVIILSLPLLVLFPTPLSTSSSSPYYYYDHYYSSFICTSILSTSHICYTTYSSSGLFLYSFISQILLFLPSPSSHEAYPFYAFSATAFSYSFIALLTLLPLSLFFHSLLPLYSTNLFNSLLFYPLMISSPLSFSHLYFSHLSSSISTSLWIFFPLFLPIIFQFILFSSLFYFLPQVTATFMFFSCYDRGCRRILQRPTGLPVTSLSWPLKWVAPVLGSTVSALSSLLLDRIVYNTVY